MRTQKINSDSSGYASSHELPVTRELPVFLSAFAKANRIPFCIWWKEKGRFCRSWDMCLLLAMPMGCSKERRYLCSPASLCDLRTAVAPILSPSYLFPHFLVLHELSLCSQTGSTANFFGSSLTIPQLSPVPSSGKDEPFPFCTHLQAGCNVWQGSIKPAPITGFPAGTGAGSPGTSAQAWWSPQGWKTEAGRFSCLLN